MLYDKLAHIASRVDLVNLVLDRHWFELFDREGRQKGYLGERLRNPALGEVLINEGGSTSGCR